MPRNRRPTPPEEGGYVEGLRREKIIAEFLRWLENHSRTPPRDLSEYPLAKFLVTHRRALARRRSLAGHYYRNTKPPEDPAED